MITKVPDLGLWPQASRASQAKATGFHTTRSYPPRRGQLQVAVESALEKALESMGWHRVRANGFDHKKAKGSALDELLLEDPWCDRDQ